MEQTIQYLKDQTAKTSANHAARCPLEHLWAINNSRLLSSLVITVCRAYAISIGLSHTELKSLCKVLRVNGAEVLQESKPAAAAQAEGEEPRVTLSTPELLMKCDPEIDCAECEECHPDPNLLRVS